MAKQQSSETYDLPLKSHPAPQARGVFGLSASTRFDAQTCVLIIVSVITGYLVLPPLERGDLVAVLDAGAYGASMSSSYNGRGRLAELVVSGGKLTRARAGETPADLRARVRADPMEL